MENWGICSARWESHLCRAYLSICIWYWSSWICFYSPYCRKGSWHCFGERIFHWISIFFWVYTLNCCFRWRYFVITCGRHDHTLGYRSLRHLREVYRTYPWVFWVLRKITNRRYFPIQKGIGGRWLLASFRSHCGIGKETIRIVRRIRRKCWRDSSTLAMGCHLLSLLCSRAHQRILLSCSRGTCLKWSIVSRLICWPWRHRISNTWFLFWGYVALCRDRWRSGPGREGIFVMAW